MARLGHRLAGFQRGAEQALAPEPPNLERAGLSREMRRPDVRLDELDAMMNDQK